MKKVIAILAVVGLTTSLFAADPKLDGIKCLLNDKGAAKADKSVEYKGGKVFFCCENCPKAFSKDVAKFATKANHQLVATGQAKQAKCPLSGGDLNAEMKVKIDGAEVTFCCNNCKGKVEAAGADEQINLVFGNVEKGFAKAK